MNRNAQSDLRRIFNEADPQGIFFEDNIDEYDGEIDAFLKVLPDCSTSSQVLEALWAIFQVKFKRSAGRKDDYSVLAEKIFHWMSERRGDNE